MGLSVALAILISGGCAAKQAGPSKISMGTIPVDVSISVDGEECAQAGILKGSQPEISQLSFIYKDEGYMKIFSGLSVSDVTRLWNDMNLMVASGIKKCNIFLNSPGGDAFTGIALARYIRYFSEQGLHMKIQASGIVASAAIPVLAAGDERFALPGTIFMVHEAALWKWPGRETASDIRSQNELMNLLRNSYMDILTTRTHTKRSDWEEMEGRTTWFDVKKAKELGLID
jgi:ATP-dependent protease ClpP protease subunit